MSDTIRVRDRKSGNIRTVTRQAYMAMGPKVYEKLGDVDATVKQEPQIHRTVSEPVISPPLQASEPEQTEDAAETEQPKKRGRKPGTKNQISSDSTEDEK
jgi:hypothetical protein